MKTQTRTKNQVGQAAPSNVPGVTAYAFPVPPSANRYWRFYRGRPVVSEEAKNYRTEVGVLARAAGVEKLTGPVAVTVKIFRRRCRGDLDNFLKVLLDSMQGVFFDNDRQVTEIHAALFDDRERPRVEVEVMRKIDL